MRLLVGCGISLIGLLFCLSLLEFGARVVEKLAQDQDTVSKDIMLDMPRWLVDARSNPERISSEEVSWFSHFESGQGFRVRLVPNISVFIPDSFSWLKNIPGTGFHVSSNTLGFRGDWELSDKHSLPRLAMFGDSSTFGWGVNDDEHFGAILEKHYGEQSVFNFAMPGDSTEFGKLIVDKFLPEIAPEIALFSFGANDARKSSVPHETLVASYAEAGELLALRTTLSSHSAFFRLFESVLDPEPSNSANVEVKRTNGRAVSLKQYRKNLVSFASTAKEAGAKRVIYLSVCAPAAYRRAMKKAAERTNSVFLDAVTLMKSAVPKLEANEIAVDDVTHLRQYVGEARLREQPLLYVSTDGCHPNLITHKLIATELINIIELEPAR